MPKTKNPYRKAIKQTKQAIADFYYNSIYTNNRIVKSNDALILEAITIASQGEFSALDICLKNNNFGKGFNNIIKSGYQSKYGTLPIIKVFSQPQTKYTPIILRKLFEAGASPNIPFKNTHDTKVGGLGEHQIYTPLQIAILKDASEESLEIMLEYGADPKQTGNVGQNCLHFLAMKGASSQIMKQFIELTDEDSINDGDINGNTALYHAAEQGSLENVQLLIKDGADINLHSDKGMPPLSAAI